MTSAKDNPVALVTGVGRAAGLGFEVCRQLAELGMTVWLTARKEDSARDLASRLAGDRSDVRPLKLDVTVDADVASAATRVSDACGQLDVLINNAAGAHGVGEAPSTADLGSVAATMDATLYGAMRTCQAFLPLMRRSGAGRIVNVSSGAGSHGDPQFGLAAGVGMGAAYGVSKAALNAYTSILATELRDTAIKVNAVCPGFVATYPGTEEMGARPVAEGAAGIVWAATLPPDGPTGGFFRDGEPLPW